MDSMKALAIAIGSSLLGLCLGRVPVEQKAQEELRRVQHLGRLRARAEREVVDRERTTEGCSYRLARLLEDGKGVLCPPVARLSVGLLAPRKDGRDLNPSLGRIEGEDKAIAPYAFPKRTSESAALDRSNVACEGICLHLF
jgi:hypothetical protein